MIFAVKFADVLKENVIVMKLTNHKVKRVHVIAYKLTDLEEDRLNHFLRTLKKEGFETD